MSAPMIRAVELEFGRHARSFELPDSGPVVIVGPNGCGKTTVVDALFRTVYGFRRRRAGDAELLQARRPWSGGPYRATIRVLDPEGRRLTWSRDFDTDVVCVRDAEGALLYDGEANPGGTGPSVERYRELVRSVFGLDDLDDFERTTCIRQGALMDTAFDDGLLALAEGGHARVRSAIDKIETAHKELSRQPVVEGGRRLNRNRLLDLASHALADTRSRLEEARRADRARGPIVLRLADLEEQEASLGAELGELESALRRLHERATAAAVREAAAERLDRLVQLRADLDAADRDAETAGRELVLRAETGEYPDDFRTRAADLRSAWTRRAALDEQLAAGGIGPAGWSMGGAGAASLVTGAWFAVRGSVVGWLGMLFGAVAGTWVLVREFAARRVRRDALAERGAVVQNIASLLEEVPDPGTVTLATLPDRLGAFEQQDEARRRLDASRKRAELISRRVRDTAEAAGTPGRSVILLESDARQRLTEAEASLRAIDQRLPDRLPNDVTFDVTAVETAIDAARARLQQVRGEREGLALELAGSARAAVDLAGLADECDVLERRVEELRRSASAHRAAHRLIREAYAEFREQDESRLIEAVSERIQGLGEPVLTGFRADDSLSGATVEIGGRTVAIDSCELSFGQRHLVKLAVRLGTADFLSGAGLAMPLVVDEPFAHLDDRHAAQVWKLLVRISEDRQVIITTQETDLLRRWGVTDGVIQLESETRPSRATLETGDVLGLSMAERAVAGHGVGERGSSDGGVE